LLRVAVIQVQNGNRHLIQHYEPLPLSIWWWYMLNS
jgi:hypothetical protein